MKRVTKLTAFLLALILVFGCSLSAFASSAGETTTESPTEAVTEATEQEEPAETAAQMETETMIESESEATFFEELMAAESCEAIFHLMNEDPDACYELTADELVQMEEKVSAMEDDGYQEDVLDNIAYLLESGGQSASTYAGPGGGGSNSGQFTHIEVEVGATVTVTIDGVEYSQTVQVTTSDTFTLTATYNGTNYPITEGAAATTVGSGSVSWTGVTTGNGATTSDGTDVNTVELSGSYWTGTKETPVYYTVTVTKDVTFTLSDGTSLTIPVTLTVKTYYWDPNNDCPGTSSTSWSNGYYVSAAGIDVPVGGTADYTSQGDLQITKQVEGLTLTESKTYTFNVYNSSNELVKTVNVTVGNSGTGVVYVSGLPVGTYTVVEVTENGAVAVDGYTCTTTVSYGDGNNSATIENNTVTVVTVTNTYTPATTTVTITKQVTGNMGDTSKEFSFTVTCNEAMAEGTGYTLENDGKTATFSLSDDQSVTLNGVKKGSTLTISEVSGGYEMTVKVGETELTKNSNGDYTYTVPTDGSDLQITVTNDKDVTIDTGVLLDAIPYILILAVVAAGAVLLLVRRKTGEK